MSLESNFYPEGALLDTAKNKYYLSDPERLKEAMAQEIILEGVVRLCDTGHNLIVELGGGRSGIIPRTDCALGIAEGKTRDIAILSRVGKAVAFRVAAVTEEAIYLNRKVVQQQAQAALLRHKRPGDIITARVTHLESFGAFVDIGFGITSLISIENISVSRIFHPSERFFEGQLIKAVVLTVDQTLGRISLTHKELLGTWEENVQRFEVGQTVAGIVRSTEDYGVFIELSPNLSGLAERREGLKIGQVVSVFIKSILPERMKIKLVIIDTLDTEAKNLWGLSYHIDGSHIDKWLYTPTNCSIKYIATIF